jgi:hypothetical protein
MPRSLLLVIQVALVGLGAVSATWADEVSIHTPAHPLVDPPGVWFEGRFYGYRGGAAAREHSATSGGPVGSGATLCDQLVGESYADGVHDDCATLGCDTAPAPVIYGSAEALLWWTSGPDATPLATTSPSGTPAGNAGVLGAAGTSVLMDADGLHDGLAPGGRFVLGTWLDECLQDSVECSFLFLAEQRDEFSGSAATVDSGILARPFFNVSLNAQDARLVAFPGVVSGSMAIASTTELQSLSLVYRRVADFTPLVQSDLVAGYRFAHLRDELVVQDSTLGLSGPDTGVARDLTDRFRTRNLFHGGEIGIIFNHSPAAGWVLDASARVALGVSQRRGVVSGQTTTTVGGQSATASGGLLTQASNSGTFDSDEFAALSEFGVTLHRQLAPGVRLLVGYDLMLWSSVWRAADQVDLRLNPTQIPPGSLVGAARPQFPGSESLYWAQGLRLGVEAKY